MNDKEAMYGSNTNIEKSEHHVRSVSPLKYSTRKFKVIEINGIKLEIINQDYVDQLESRVGQLERALKTASTKTSRALREINTIYNEISSIKRELSKKQNLFNSH